MHPEKDQKEEGWLMKAFRAVGSLFASLLYVIFLPFIGLVMLAGLVLRKLVPSRGAPRAPALGEVYQDGGEPLDGRKEKGEDGKAGEHPPGQEGKKDGGSRRE